MPALHAALCWARGRAGTTHIHTVVLVFTVAAVGGEAQVGRCRQMFCAAVNLRRDDVKFYWQFSVENCKTTENLVNETFYIQLMFLFDHQSVGGDLHVHNFLDLCFGLK